MTIEQAEMRNPFGMDEQCTNCPELAESRTSIVHGYGDVTADFLFVCESPSATVDQAGHPLVTRTDGYGLLDVLAAAGLTVERERDLPPALDNAFVSHLTRCHHPDRPATDREVTSCEPFLNAEIRSINPEIICPVGERPLSELLVEYTTEDSDAIDLESVAGTEIRGRGFELLPMHPPASLSTAGFREIVETLNDTMARDYRQTKGRQGR